MRCDRYVQQKWGVTTGGSAAAELMHRTPALCGHVRTATDIVTGNGNGDGTAAPARATLCARCFSMTDDDKHWIATACRSSCCCLKIYLFILWIVDSSRSAYSVELQYKVQEFKTFKT